MKMNRRDFLKGMLAISGAVALTQIPEFVVDEVLAAKPDLYIAPQRTYGRLGAVKLNERWYALEDASITMLHHYTSSVYLPGTLPGTYDVIKPKRLVDSSWQLDLDLGQDPYDVFKMGDIEFEIDGRGVNFSGKGYAQVTGIGNFVRQEDEPISYLLQIEGDEKLVRL